MKHAFETNLIYNHIIIRKWTLELIRSKEQISAGKLIIQRKSNFHKVRGTDSYKVMKIIYPIRSFMYQMSLMIAT